MRKLWLIIPVLVVAVALALMAQPIGTTEADNGPHMAGSWGFDADGCAACHRVHRGLNDMLILAEVEGLCLTCHGNGASGSTLNVTAGTDEGEPGGALRAGGFEFARINTADPSLPIPVWPEGLPRAQQEPYRDRPSPCYQIGIDGDGDGVLDDGCSPLITARSTGQETRSSHSVDGSLQTIWGNGPISADANPGLADYELDCGKCHDPHGNGNYRILASVPDGSGGAGYAIPDTYPNDEDAGDYSTSNYFNMTFDDGVIPDDGGSYLTDNILKDTSAWCAQCHTRYLAARNDPVPANASRVDSGDAIFRFRHSSAGWGNSSAGVASNNNRACITCHAVHGSNATAGEDSGEVPDPDGTTPPESARPANSKLLKMNNRGMCQKCHNQ